MKTTLLSQQNCAEPTNYTGYKCSFKNYILLKRLNFKNKHVTFYNLKHITAKTKRDYHRDLR